jgi:hypothetical protein
MGEPWFWFVMTLFTCGFALPFWVISIIVKHRKPGPKSKIQYRPYYEE